MMLFATFLSYGLATSFLLGVHASKGSDDLTITLTKTNTHIICPCRTSVSIRPQGSSTTHGNWENWTGVPTTSWWNHDSQTTTQVYESSTTTYKAGYSNTKSLSSLATTAASSPTTWGSRSHIIRSTSSSSVTKSRTTSTSKTETTSTTTRSPAPTDCNPGGPQPTFFLTAADSDAVPERTPAFIWEGPDYGVFWFNGSTGGMLTFNDDCNLIEVSNNRITTVYGETFGGIFIEEPYDIIPDEKLLICQIDGVGDVSTLHCTGGNGIEIFQIRPDDYLAIGESLHEGYSTITLVVNFVR
jgi:hypothetical protein